MKNLLLSTILVLLSLAGYSSSRGIEIFNRSQCDVYLQLHGSSKCPDCEIEFKSCLMVIPAASSVIFPNTTTICGFPINPPAFVHSALIYSGPRHCQPLQTWIVGDPKCYQPETIIWTMNQDCKRLCDCLRVRWEPGGCDGIARLFIEPC